MLAEPVPRPAPPVKYHYSSGLQYAETDGTYANLVIGKPDLAEEDYHTLAEIAVQSADGKQIVEVGWTVDRGVNGDDDPHLFVYHWVDGKETCYNGCGFKQYSKTVVARRHAAGRRGQAVRHPVLQRRLVDRVRLGVGRLLPRRAVGRRATPGPA